MEIPSLSVEETIAPGSPEMHNKWKFTCSQLLSAPLLSRWARPCRQCDSNLYKRWSSAAPFLQPRGCGDGTAGTEAVVSPSLFPVKQRRRKTAETLPSELHCPPAVTHRHTHTSIYAQCVLVIELITSSRGSKPSSPANVSSQSITQISYFRMRTHQ